MSTKKVLLLILLFCIVSIIISIITISLYAHYVILREFLRNPEYRVLSAEEIRPIFNQITERQLPDKVENLRAIYSDFRSIEDIYLSFQTDQEGFSYILNGFGGQKVQVIEFPESEVTSLWRDGVVRAFLKGCYQQEDLGIELFDENLLNRIRTDLYKRDHKTRQYPSDAVAGWCLDYSVKPTKYYSILLFKEKHLVYIFAGKNPNDIVLR